MKMLLLAIGGALLAGGLTWALDLHSHDTLHNWLAALHGH